MVSVPRNCRIGPMLSTTLPDDTHDVDHEDLRARLGGCVLGLVRDSAEVADEVLSGQAAQ